jgi:hypothetical protein
VFESITRSIDGGTLNKLALGLLSDVPGSPPIIQTIHLLGITAVMGSIVLIDLNVLGLALRSQSTRDLVRRLMPWTWWAFPALATSGLVFILARPYRYFLNPVFGAKFAMLVPAVLLAVLFQAATTRNPEMWTSSRGRVLAKAVAALSLFLWVGVVFAGRWIAYVDYLFPVPE